MRRQTIGLATIAGGVILLGTACQVDIETSGNTVTETIEVNDFTELEVSSAFDVIVEIGDEPSIEIDLDEEVRDRLEVEQDGDRVSIGFDGGLLSVSGPLEARITTTDLTSISFSGAVDGQITGLDTDQLDVELSGASEVTGRGSVGVLVIDADGASEADFSGIEADRAELDVTGASSVDVSGAAEVSGRASGASTIEVASDLTQADLDVDLSGAASID